MPKVKLFSRLGTESLEKDINKFIQNNKVKSIIRLEYTPTNEVGKMQRAALLYE